MRLPRLQILLAAVLLAGVIACSDDTAPAPAPAPPAPAAPAPPAPPPAPPGPAPAADDVAIRDAEATCTSDDACTLVTEGCCGCTALGRHVGVRKDALPAITRRRQPICDGVMCAQALSDDPSCAAQRAVCRDGRCVPDVPGGPPGGPGAPSAGAVPIP